MHEVGDYCVWSAQDQPSLIPCNMITQTFFGLITQSSSPRMFSEAKGTFLALCLLVS